MSLGMEPTPKMSPKTSSQTSRATDDLRWQAVVHRDSAFDGAFVYAVKTTGIYCRPGCASRTAKRANVTFFASGKDAKQSGFRACRRCHPDGNSQAARNAGIVTRACRMIERSESMPSLDTLAAKAGLSPFHFHRIFKASTGLTPKAYGSAHRERRVRKALSSGRSSITQAIYDAGFGSNSRFYEKSDAILGMKPSAFLNAGATTEVHFSIGECSLGSILVACSERGICAILLGNDPKTLTRDLKKSFSNARLIEGGKSFAKVISRVVACVEAPGTNLDLPLDIRGTAFQQRVWQALSKIPAGRLTTYTELAKTIGAPSAIRAVASACAANRLAVAIPCHRVVRSDGGLAGYRWGVTRKKALIEKERSSAKAPTKANV